MKPSLKPGIEYELRFRVGASKTVPRLYPESPEFLSMPEVFATGFYVGLLEWCCVMAIKPHLDGPDEMSVGTHIDVSHCAGTPVGLEVVAKARLTEVDGRRLAFEVEAYDDQELIGKGRHERFIIDAPKFNAKMAQKKAKYASGGA
ncbi:MAG: thioesterase family protein [Rhodocyclaceae bacterium]|nr:thioesterase family protein [Rhodocyclaceae bacterium]MBX3668471.1 thioesterase family protein [Rhodocyclaceae bacterium]